MAPGGMGDGDGVELGVLLPAIIPCACVVAAVRQQRTAATNAKSAIRRNMSEIP